MSFVERRRFLWILFVVSLAALALTVALANATTLARLTFDDLAQGATAVARLKCLGSDMRWEQGEIWTGTRKFRRGGIRNRPVAVFQLKLRRALQERN